MTMLAEIAGYMITNGIGTAIGTDIFIGEIPASPDACYCLLQSRGRPPMRTFDNRDLMPQLQILIRGAFETYTATEAKALAVSALFGDVRNTTIGSTVYKSISSQGEIDPFSDSQQRPMFEQNFNVWKGT